MNIFQIYIIFLFYVYVILCSYTHSVNTVDSMWRFC